MGKIRKIDFSAERFGELAEKFYSEGKYVESLRFTFREIEEYGETLETLTRLCDIYENLGLSSTAIKYLFKALDISDSDDWPDIYEGLAVNYLNMGKEAQSALYYNRLIESDKSISNEMKLEIAEAFSQTKKPPLKISYPPKLVDYTEDLAAASRALKRGDCQSTIRRLDGIEEGSKAYEEAQEMLSLAYVLSGELDRAKEVCSRILEKNPNSIRAYATLAAAYLESDEQEKSRAIAEKLSTMQTDDEEEVYKIATVCCENGLHRQAYERFKYLEKQAPFDGRLLYFKGVSAYKSGLLKEAINAFSELYTVYPDAAVVRYYLEEMRREQLLKEKGEEVKKIDVNYFYTIPLPEREQRIEYLMTMEKASKEEVELLGMGANALGIFQWCFDERDGMDYDLQYLACLAACRSYQDEFLREILLDNEVIDALKVETLRMLYERNEGGEQGVVFYDVYHKVKLLPIEVGRKKRKKILQAYARTASRFSLLNSDFAERMKASAELLYRALETFDCLDHADNVEECACAIYLLSEVNEWGKNIEKMSSVFEANADRVRVLLTTVACYRQSDKDLDLIF